jgi:hypothetical protein
MSWAADTLAAFKAWLGATTATDAQLTAALELALATVESWLDRPLELVERTQEDFDANCMVRLRAWPVESVASVTYAGQAADVAALALDKRTGRLGVPFYWGTITTVYTGGFATMPRELELVLWSVAAALLPAASSSAGVDMGQAVRRVTTPDVGTVEYATATASEGQAAQFLGGAAPPQFEAVLSRYRAESIVGGA